MRRRRDDRLLRPGAHFRDPAFGDLDGDEIGAMWRMLTGRATDLKIELHEHDAGEESGTADWIARLTFNTAAQSSTTSRPSSASPDGLIADHVDDFDFRRWAEQALGPMGHLVAVLPPLRSKARAKRSSSPPPTSSTRPVPASEQPRSNWGPPTGGKLTLMPPHLCERMFVRWDEQRVENDLRLPGVGDGTVIRTFDAPEAMGINFHEVHARSALNHVPGGRFGFDWTINPFRGCSHACVFCRGARRRSYGGRDHAAA